MTSYQRDALELLGYRKQGSRVLLGIVNDYIVNNATFPVTVVNRELKIFGMTKETVFQNTIHDIRHNLEDQTQQRIRNDDDQPDGIDNINKWTTLENLAHFQTFNSNDQT
ncbi:hypothetical protein GUJ93_ZPchr0010g11133 [Zizania palustris]|uniref:Uncharacterized protein n=1 Tax=Zizania palustris TaxID=103762 RepID=A0A8J5TIB2_ZIZPA|nr:hypothetical protein GUJ93_ZPchr0010g11133 [Zizania palustris]